MAREWFGRIAEYDDRDWQYPASQLTAARGEQYDWQYWWDLGWWGDQGRTPQCVAYAWLHCLSDGPATRDLHKLPQPDDLYCEAQKRDAWDGDCTDPKYDGTSVRAGAKVLRDLGLLAEYRWCSTVSEAVDVLLNVGPIVVGSRWPDGFMETHNGYVGFTRSGDAGHAYVLNGVNKSGGKVRLKNSWGREWGDEGRAWMTMRALSGLVNGGAELCVPVIA
jgi:hypothetical protein